MTHVRKRVRQIWQREDANLVSGSNGDLLCGPVAGGTDVDQIDTDFFQLANEDLALLNAPLFP